jgi:branched-chain amino acid transport system permease protein
VISGSTVAQSLLSGVLEGTDYALYSLGLAFVFGILRIINLAHGEVVVLGGYVAYWMLVKFGIGPLAALPLAALAGAAVGLASYRVFLRNVRAAPELNTLILTFGIGIFLANLFLQMWSGDLRSIEVEWLQEPLSLGPIRVSAGELVAFAVSIAAVLGLQAFLARTRMGKAIRVTAIDRDSASLAGIDVERVDWAAFTVGGMLAGVAGPLLGVLAHVSPGAGAPLTIKAFILTVLAGIGSIPGLVVAGVILGVGEAMTVTFASSSYRELFGFGLFLLILLVRPTGLFGKAHA